MAVREPDALTTGAASTVPPVITTGPPDLCTTCHVNPRHAHGRLSRCLDCVRAEAERARNARAEAERIVVARRAELTKPCRCCQKVKALADFAPHPIAKDGRRRDCRSCVARGRAKGKLRTPAQLAKDRERANRPERKTRNLEAVHRWQATNKAALQAHKAVSVAVREGKLTPPSSCQVQGCRRRKRLHAHHRSYHPKCRLKVIWMCAQHHKSIHSGLKLKLKAGAAFKTAVAPATA